MLLLSSLVSALCFNHACDDQFPFDFFSPLRSSFALLLEENHGEVPQLRNQFNFTDKHSNDFQPQKKPRKGNPDHVPLAWRRAEVAAFTLNLPTAFRRGEEPPGHVPPVCFAHVTCSFECLQLAAAPPTYLVSHEGERPTYELARSLIADLIRRV